MIRELHLFVTGDVQGVGFRAACKKEAQIHQIGGFAKNLPDGRVEICAQGKESNIQDFLKAIESKPGISKIEKMFRPIQNPYPSFEIQ